MRLATVVRFGQQNGITSTSEAAGYELDGAGRAYEPAISGTG